MLLQAALTEARRPASTEDGTEDDSVVILPQQAKSCRVANEALYKYCFQPSELGSTNICGRIYKGFGNGVFPVIGIEKVFTQNETPSSEKFSFDSSTMAFKKKQSNVRFDTTTEVMYRLRILFNTIAFIAPVFPISGEWTGKGAKVGTTKVQWSRQCTEIALGRWQRYVSKYSAHPDQLARAMYRVAKLVPDYFADNVYLIDSYLNAFDELRGEIASFRPAPKPPGGPPPGNPQIANQKRDRDPPNPNRESPYDIAKKSRYHKEELKTVPRTLGQNGDLICKRWNDGRDGAPMTCKFGAHCTFKHCCDVLVDGKACAHTDHCRISHP